MAFIEGRTVKDKIAERPLKLEEALDITIQTAQGLQAAHEKGIVHRDIKGANLMVTPQGQVKVMDFGLAQLAERSQLTKTATILASWSPNGRWIAFDAVLDGNADIYVISADGGLHRRLTTEGSQEINPSWSRDGKWIYFSSNRTGMLQVWRAPAAGGEAVQVTKIGSPVAFESPDGKFVFYAKIEDSQFDPTAVWRVPAEGGEEVAVPDSPRPVSFGAWAAVEQGIYFIDVERSEALVAEGFLKFFRFDTRRVTRIASLGEQLNTDWVQVAVSPDGGWILYVQDDQYGADLMLLENFR